MFYPIEYFYYEISMQLGILGFPMSYDCRNSNVKYIKLFYLNSVEIEQYIVSYILTSSDSGKIHENYNVELLCVEVYQHVPFMIAMFMNKVCVKKGVTF